MTISYSGNFCSLLFRWRGSLWKAVWRELFIFLCLYFAIRLFYYYGLSADQQTTFEKVSIMFNHYTQFIPLTFLLGFYISSIVARWWQQFQWVAWPDDLLSMICFIFYENDEETNRIRHQMARYLCLTCALSWRDISVKVRSRFPSIDNVVLTGLMTPEEKKLYDSTPAVNIRWALPLQWIQAMIRKRFDQGKIPAPIAGGLIKELGNYRLTFRKLYCYDWVCIPLVYTQVTAVATYGYFLFCLIGRQTLNVEKNYKYNDVDMIIPVFTILQFLFYIGWFKVGQELFRPFGLDDDDIELNYILNRHVQASFAMVDNVLYQEPPLTEDKFWNKSATDINLGHTKMSAKIREHPPKLHAQVTIKNESDKEYVEEKAPLTDRQAKRVEKKNHREF